MKLRQFVSVSAVVLAGWLAVTFVHRVPAQRYPKHQKHASRVAPSAPRTVMSGAGQLEKLQVSLSR